MPRLITGLTPQREQALQERLMLRLARSAEKPIQREIARASRAIANDVDDAMETHRLRMQDILSRLYMTAFDTFGRRIVNASRKSLDGMEFKKDTFAPTPRFDLARKLWIQSTAATKVTQITGTTELQATEIIRQATADAIEQGLDEKATAKLIRSRIGEQGGQLSRLRSRVISRTESHSASNASNQIAANQSGLDMRREWIASGGERTREDHRNANGQKVGMNEPFTVGGELLMQPGDPSGSAEQVINCRCIVGYSI